MRSSILPAMEIRRIVFDIRNGKVKSFDKITPEEYQECKPGTIIVKEKKGKLEYILIKTSLCGILLVRTEKKNGMREYSFKTKDVNRIGMQISKISKKEIEPEGFIAGYSYNKTKELIFKARSADMFKLHLRAPDSDEERQILIGRSLINIMEEEYSAGFLIDNPEVIRRIENTSTHSAATLEVYTD